MLSNRVVLSDYIIDDKSIFDIIIEHANRYSTCNKLAVGSGFLVGNTLYLESNRSIDYNCKEFNECYKAKITGIYESCEETRKYCKAVHAEINMINSLKEENIDPRSGILYVSRYPCYNCAKSCIEFGFKQIIYAGIQEISDDVKKIFRDADIKVRWCKEIDYEY